MLKAKVLLVLSLVMFPFTLVAAELTASVDNKQVAYGETVMFSLFYDGSDGNSLMPDLSVLQKDFDIRDTSSSISMQYINGTQSQRREWRLTLSPKSKGNITIPAIRAGKYVTQPIDIEVLSAKTEVKKTDNSSAVKDSQEQSAFFEATWDISDENPYVEQEITAVLSVKDNRDMQFSREPNFENADDWEIKVLQQPQVSNKNGEKITKFFYAMAPLKSGRLELPRAVIDGFYTVYDNASQRPQSFGDSFMQFFDMNITNFMGVQKPVLFRSDIETVNVKPIPENYAGKQWVPALILLATSEWKDKNPKFKVGETVARYITIVASGLSENRLPDIKLPENPDWKQYPDKPQYSSAVHDGKFVSQETVRVVYIPQKSGKMVLPEIRIPWFNVKTGKTEYAVVESQEIDVAPNAAYENISLPEKEQAVRSEPKEQPKVKAAKKKNNSQNDNKLVVFVAAIIAFISGLIVSFLLFGRKQKSNKKITESDNLKSIRQALDKKDYREVRDSLLQWGQNVFLHERINNLQDLVNMMEDDEFASQCEILNSLLYSHTDKTLDEKVIINALKNAGRKKTRKTDTPLPNLYK